LIFGQHFAAGTAFAAMVPDCAPAVIRQRHGTRLRGFPP
jgi:hypothetical protein